MTKEPAASTGPPAGIQASAAQTAPTAPQPVQGGSAARAEGPPHDFSSWYDPSPRSGGSPPGSGSAYPPPAGYGPPPAGYGPAPWPGAASQAPGPQQAPGSHGTADRARRRGPAPGTRRPGADGPAWGGRPPSRCWRSSARGPGPPPSSCCTRIIPARRRARRRPRVRRPVARARSRPPRMPRRSSTRSTCGPPGRCPAGSPRSRSRPRPTRPRASASPRRPAGKSRRAATRRT